MVVLEALFLLVEEAVVAEVVIAVEVIIILSDTHWTSLGHHHKSGMSEMRGQSDYQVCFYLSKCRSSINALNFLQITY